SQTLVESSGQNKGHKPLESNQVVEVAESHEMKRNSEAAVVVDSYASILRQCGLV
ncbi:hypothetical protein A2U01_0100300, partial [Trifolium medium]|nr:hypothetical protein [Trifolium medium]